MANPSNLYNPNATWLQEEGYVWTPWVDIHTHGRWWTVDQLVAVELFRSLPAEERIQILRETEALV